MHRVGGRSQVLYAGGLEDAVTLPAAALERLGAYDVTQVRTLEAALEAVETTAFDCLVATTGLADGDVPQVARRAREAAPELPIVLVGPDASDAGAILDEPSVRVVETVSQREPAGDLVARQVDRLVDRPAGGTNSLAAVPRPAFTYDGGFVAWNDAFGSLVEWDEQSLAERSLADVFDCAPTELADAAAAGTALETTVAGSEPPRTVSLSAGRHCGEYVCLVEETTTENATAGERSAAAMLESLLEGIPLAIYYKDRESRHVAVSDFQVGRGHEWAVENPEGKVHHAPEDVVGKTDYDLYPTARAERAVEDDRDVMETEEVSVEEGAVVTVQEMEEVGTATKDLAMTTVKAPWYDEHGDVVGVVGVTLDVTEQWEAERRAAAGDAVVETVDEILRTQIRPALRELTDEEADSDASAAEPLGRALSDVELLVRNHESDARELVDLGVVAREVWTALERDGATLSIASSGLVEANPTRLRALLTELLENAVVHAGPDVDVVLGTLDDGFYVEDDGPGIEPARRSEAFDYGTSTVDGRVGGGLAVVDAVARSHGWSTGVAEGGREGARVVVSDVRFH